MPTEKTEEFRKFERMFKSIRREKEDARIHAVGLLNRNLLQKHIKSGQDLILQYGRQGGYVRYTLSDLQDFEKALRKSKTEYGSEKGVPLAQLLAASDPIDRERANQELRNATMYRLSGNLIHFRVSASPQSTHKPAYHQVRLRLENWLENMLTPGAYIIQAKEAVNGRISFDCDCGRHQFWYRYLATLGNFALAPEEKDFPKIRNPQLKGCCCKHVIKALLTLRTPVVYSLLAKEIEKQAAAEGFWSRSTKKRAKFYNEEDRKRSERASKQKKASDEETERAWKEFKKHQEAFKKKQEEMKQKERQEEEKKKQQDRSAEELKKEAEESKKKEKAQKARAENMKRRWKKEEAQKKAAEAENEQLKRDMEKKRKADAEDAEKMARDIMANKLSMFIDSGKPKKRSKEASMEMFAEVNSMTFDEVRALVKRYKI